MTLHLGPLTLHEFDVVATDLLLGIESAAFAYVSTRIQTARPLLRRWIVRLFLAMSASSLLAATFHAFFTLQGPIWAFNSMWLLVAAAIGGVVAVLWALTVLFASDDRFFGRARPAIGIYLLAYLLTMVFVDANYSTIIFFYAPPILALILISLRKSQWGIAASLLLSLVASWTQYAQIIIHPVYFNHNALYHVLEGIALAMLFVSFRRPLAAPAQSLHADMLVRAI